jgi:hypothetical protein
MLFPIEQRDLQDPVAVNVTATKIWCFLVYPQSETERKEAENLLNIEMVEHLKAVEVNDLEDPRVKEFALHSPEKWEAHKKQHIQNNVISGCDLPDDVTKLLLNSKSLADVKAVMTDDILHNQWNTVYFLMKALLCMHIHGTGKRGGASMKKALHLFEFADLDRKFYVNNPRYAREAWNKFLPVCHILFAYLHLLDNPENDKFYIYDARGLNSFLGFAKAIQDMLLDVRVVQNKNKPLVNENELYKIPHNLKLPEITCNFDPLVPEYQEIINNYQYL